MLSIDFGIYQYAINEKYDKHIEEVFERPIYKIHECRWGVFQAERLHNKLIMTVSASESRPEK